MATNNPMEEFKNSCIKDVISCLMRKLECSELEAVTKLQGTAAKKGNEILLGDLCKYKSDIIGL